MPERAPVSAAIQRQWELLQLIPRSPRRTHVGRVLEQLRDRGMTVHHRTIQRDLETLSSLFVSLCCDRANKPYAWFWDAAGDMLEVPTMSVQQAVVFELLSRHLSHALPSVTRDTLAPHFARARAVLASNRRAKLARWPDKLRVIGEGQPREQPAIERQVLDAVAAALVQERCLQCLYQPRGRQQARSYVLHPLGLLIRARTMILVCHQGDHQDVRQFMLHRMRQAIVTKEPAVVPATFNLDRFIAEGIGYRKGTPLQLVARIRDTVALSLSEAPLSSDQVLIVEQTGWQRVSATVADTLELRGWLMSYGAMLEVLEPQHLRDEISSQVIAAAQLYGKASRRQ